MKRLLRIGLLTGTGFAFIREILHGINGYAKQRGGWAFDVRSPGMPGLKRILRSNPQGVIARVVSRSDQARLRRLGIPIVCVGNTIPTDLPHVHSDDLLVGAMVADEFIGRGLRSFGFVTAGNSGFSVARQQGFEDRLAQAGFSCSVFNDRYGVRSGNEPIRSVKSYRSWLTSLAFPAGIMTSNDFVAIHTLDVARLAGLRIPDDVAVIGVDDDQLLCEMANPSLSSVRLGTYQIGYQAARLVEQMIQGETPDSNATLIPPVAIVTRQSSDFFAVDDPALCEALTFIRARFTDPIGVNDILGQVTVSRRHLEMAFQRNLGRSPLEEIHRVRLNRAMHLLASTNLSLPRIAELTGFSSGKHLSALFGAKIGQTAMSYRRRHGAPKSPELESERKG